MPSLNEAKNKIIELANKFGWGRSREHVATKIYYAMIELGEAGDAWKHRDDPEWLKQKLNINNDAELTKHVAEELIDAIFYCLNGVYCLDPNINVDQEFDRKWNINLNRGRIYMDDQQR